MSDTPRTDNAWNEGFDPVILSAAQLARRLREQCAALERENAALRKQLEQWNQSTEWFAEWAEKKEDLERELAALRDDRELLDWLCTADGSAWIYRYLYKREKLTMDAIRAVRDEARQ